MTAKDDIAEIKIVGFDPRFIKDQARIGKIHTNTWKYYDQSDETDLTGLYTQEDFDHRTRFYAIKSDITEGKLQGFLTTKLLNDEQAHFAPPIVKNNGNSGFLLKKQLIHHAIDTLREMGIKKIYMTSSPSWDQTDDLISELGFRFHEVLFQQYIGKIDDFLNVLHLDSSTGFGKVVDYTYQFEVQLTKLLGRTLNIPEKAMRNILENNLLPNLKNEITKVLLNTNDNVIGWIRGSVIEERKDHHLSLTPGYIFEHDFEESRGDIIKSVLFEAKNQGIEEYKLILTKMTFKEATTLDLGKLQLENQLTSYSKLI